jgi:hypothetical protein
MFSRRNGSLAALVTVSVLPFATAVVPCRTWDEE